jgi:hypothetical protein
MERSRSTHKQKRRHDALRRTLRRQGALSPQEGGARAADWSLVPTGYEPAKAFLKENVLDSSSGFSFIVADEDDWRAGPDAAKKYAPLIMNQDDLLSLGLAKIRSALGITDETTDGELVSRVFAASDDTITTYRNALQILAESVMQDEPTAGGKVAYNLYSDSAAPTRAKLINLLLYPTLMTNVVMNGIAEVLKTLKRETLTYEMVVSTDATKRTIYHGVLADKYTWYIFGAAASYTNDSLKDSFCLWESNTMANESRWKAFFTEFFGHLVTGDAVSFGTLQKELQRTYKTEEKYYVKEMGNGKTPDTIICSLISALVFRAYNAGKDMKECIAPFAIKLAEKAELQDIPVQRTSAAVRPYQTAPTVQQLTGMLADPTTWEQPLFDGDDELSKQITFTNLLNNLNPRHIHFLLHLVGILYKQTV